MMPRRRRQVAAAALPCDAWPPVWRELAARWLRRDSARCKWPTLLAAAGSEAYETAHDVLDALLTGGWIVVDEAFQQGRWQPLWIEFPDLPALRAALGLPAPGATKAAQEAARNALLTALERWNADPARPDQATRRDFAQYARGDTKSITTAEWDWLETQADLAACGIAGHAPLLCIAAPVNLFLPQGRLDLAATPDFLGIPPAALTAATGGDAAVRHWTLVENRSSFERVARQRAKDAGVLWLPGFPPGWWQTAVARLLALAPAPARIACDPDPAGIEIALTAGKLWQAAGLDWQPWRMDAADLTSLPARKPLTVRDLERLAALLSGALPDPLRALALALQAGGEKGEQEGYL
ncbi:MAG: DUF2399 domain-containing protein [Sulfuritalea sp.]|nr:DUF2399 domain-containing protein [Sulfuritalea sp.]